MRTRRSKFSSDPMPSVSEKKSEGHRSVLLHEAIDSLNIQPADTVVDATLGGAGHAREIARLLQSQGTFVGFDLDPDAIARAKEVLADASFRVELIESNFRTMGAQLSQRGIVAIDRALFDLGWSSFQLAVGRGFSFQTDEPLLMTYAKDAPLTARVIVNNWEESSIADVVYGWGEERYARRIARAIVEARQLRPIETARELAEIVKAAVPAVYRYGRIHPATKTFQALRIAVNDELGALHEGISSAWHMLAPGGRIAVITFHSIEDRAVKRLFADFVAGGGALVYKKPRTASEEELRENPRARSAKLRVIEKPQSLQL